MPHPAEHGNAARPLGADEAEALAESMRAFGSATRLRVLFTLLEREHTVDELAAAIDTESSAVSHQLRLLRQLRLVAVRRHGRHASYRLHDHHVRDLLTSIRHHQEHLALPAPDEQPAPAERQA